MGLFIPNGEGEKAETGVLSRKKAIEVTLAHKFLGLQFWEVERGNFVVLEQIVVVRVRLL